MPAEVVNLLVFPVQEDFIIYSELYSEESLTLPCF